MSENWFSISYLKSGSAVQQKAFNLLSELGIMEALAPFKPVLTGTFPLDIPVQESDLDICCECYSFPALLAACQQAYGKHQGYTTKEKRIAGTSTLLVRFFQQELLIEIFAQPVPFQEQQAFRHMLAEHTLLQKYGEPLRQQVLELKESGYKTEPAFAKALGLEGNPYESLLRFCP